MANAKGSRAVLLAWLVWAGTGRAMAAWVALGIFLAIPALGPHLALDDFILGLAARGEPRVAGLPQGAFDLFSFTTGLWPDNRALIDQGVMLPWWSDPQLGVAFFRPLSSLTHRLDWNVFGGRAPVMYVHSLLWFGATLGVVAWLYRRLEDTDRRVAGLALLMFAVDDAHGGAIGWISNRNALIATTLGVIVIILFDMGQKGRRPAAIASPLLLGVSLLAGEFAAGALAYVISHAVFLGDGKVVRRTLAAVPHLIVVVLWRLIWGAAGYGVHGSGAYVDPLGSPATFAVEMPFRLLALLHGAFSVPPSDVFFLAPPAHRPALVAVGVLTVAVVTYLIVPLLRQDARARFWLGGALLSALPVSASFSSDRLLLFVGIGVMATLARLFVATLDGAGPSRLRRLLVGAFAVLHLCVAPLLLPVRAAQMQLLGGLTERVQRSLDVALDGGARTVIVASAPSPLLAGYLTAERLVEGRGAPSHFYWLATGSSDVRVERVGDAELLVQPSEGFVYTPLERHYRGSMKGLESGSLVELPAMTARVERSLPDGRPGVVRFSFSRSLDDPSLLLLRWVDDHYEPLVVSEGQFTVLPAQDIGQLLTQHALSLVPGGR